MERISYDKTKEENSVELLFAKKFEALKQHPMNDDTSSIMIKLAMSNGAIPEDDEEINDNFMIKIITGRFKVLGYTMDIRTKLMIASITGSPGAAVMYCHYLAYFCKQHNIIWLTFDDFCMKAFPWGFPSEEDLNILWDSQKVHKDSSEQPGTDNLLDYLEASKSIMAL
jgi:hypothetical protein